MKFKSWMYLQNGKEAGPAFSSLPTLGSTFNHNWLQMSVHLAKSHRKNISWNSYNAGRNTYDYLGPVYLPLTCIIERVSCTTSTAIPLLPTLSLLISCWLTDGPCTLFRLLTHTSRYIYSHFSGYPLTSCFCCLGQHWLRAVKFSKPWNVSMTTHVLRCLNFGDSFPWFPTIMSRSMLTKSCIPSV